MRTRILTAAAVALAGTFTIAATAPATTASAFPNATSTIFINELHYDNTGTDAGEFVEVAGPAGTDLTGWVIVLYNGSNSLVYDTDALSGVIADQGGGYGTVTVNYPSNGIQNGSPDGIALVDNGSLVQFLSYEGAITAVDGPAAGVQSTDIGVSQAGTEAVGSSLHLIGTGTTYGNFTWATTTDDSPGAINTGQTFVAELAVSVDPVSQTVATGSPATITATPTGGTEPYGYQWFEGSAPGTMLSGEIGADLTVTPGTAGPVAYYVEVTDGAATTVASSTATVTAEAPVPPALEPIVPSSYTVETGDSVELTVTVASGTGPFTYEWFSGTPGTGLTTGVTTATFNSGALAADISFYVVVAGAAGAANAATSNVVTVTVVPPPCANPIDLISEIQGTTETSPCVGESVVVEGIVVGDYEGSSPLLRGFYIQSRDGDQDADPLTSEGLYVFNGTNNQVALGDEVRVTGTVSEFQGQTQVSSSTTTLPVVISSGNSVTPATPILPVATADGLERFEGMSVTFTQELTVTELFQLGRFGQVTVSAGGRLVQPTSIVEPGADAIALQAANNLRKIIIDDVLQAQNADPIVWGRNDSPLSASNTLRGGDITTGATGVLTYTWGGNSASPNAYRLRPASPAAGDIANITFTAANPRPAGPPEVGGTLKVVGFNVLNYFRTLDVGTARVCGPSDPPGLLQECRGAETPEELTRQHDKLIAALLQIDADVFGFAELENSTGVDPLQPLIDGLNAVVGADTWASVDTNPATVGADTIGTDTIRVGVIYRQDRVEPVGVPAVLDNSVDPTFDDDRNRPSLAVSFSELATGEEMTVVVNHWKSKGCGGATGSDADQFDGAGCWDTVRTAAATAVVNWLDGYPTGVADDDVLIFGDLNSYAQEDPIDVLRDAGYVDLVQEFNPGAYSYVFNGQWGTLDYAFGSASLTAQVTGADDYHINADEPSILDYNTNFKSAAQILSLYSPDEFRTSDHDPAIVGLDLGGEEPTVTVDQAAGQADPTAGTSVEFTVVFSAPVTGFEASDVVVSGTATTGTPVVTGTEPGTTFTVTIPVTADGTVIVDIPAGAANIELGAPSLASTSTDNTVAVDTSGPSVTVTPPAPPGNRPGPAVYVIEFSEPVTGLLVSELEITGRTDGYTPELTTTDNITWTLTFTSNDPGAKFNANQVSVSVPEGVAVDAAGNTNTESNVTHPGRVRPSGQIAV